MSELLKLLILLGILLPFIFIWANFMAKEDRKYLDALEKRINYLSKNLTRERLAEMDRLVDTYIRKSRCVVSMCDLDKWQKQRDKFLNV